MFAYCNNNPINYTDSSGTLAAWAVALIVVAAVVVITAIDHHVAKRCEDGKYAIHKTGPTSNGVSSKWGYVEGNGFELNENGVTLFDSTLGVGTVSYNAEDEYVEVSEDFLNIATASAVANLDWSGVPSLDIGAIASALAFKCDLSGKLWQWKFTLTGEIHLGAAGVGIEFDPEAGKFEFSPPQTGIVCSLGADIDRL